MIFKQLLRNPFAELGLPFHLSPFICTGAEQPMNVKLINTINKSLTCNPASKRPSFQGHKIYQPWQKQSSDLPITEQDQPGTSHAVPAERKVQNGGIVSPKQPSSTGLLGLRFREWQCGCSL